MQNFRQLKVWEPGPLSTLPVHTAPRLKQGPETGLFSKIAACSAREMEYQLLLVHEVNLLNTLEHERFTKEVTGVKRMLPSFVHKMKANS
jgi:hypothetical protein